MELRARFLSSRGRMGSHSSVRDVSNEASQNDERMLQRLSDHIQERDDFIFLILKKSVRNQAMIELYLVSDRGRDLSTSHRL